MQSEAVIDLSGVRIVAGEPQSTRTQISYVFPDQRRAYVEDIPDWLDVSKDTLFNSIALTAYFAGDLNTEGEFQNAGELEPIAGIASGGTPFNDLTESEKFAYLANSEVIAVAKNHDNASAYVLAQEKLDSIRAEISAPFDGSGEPPLWQTRRAAIERIGAQVKLQGAETKTMAVTAQRTDLAAPPMPALPVPTLEGCLTLPFDQRSPCVRDILKANPQLAAVYEGTVKPWKDVASPDKWLQPNIIGLDGKRYVVALKGEKQIGIRTAYVMGVVVLATLGGATVVGGLAFWSFGTKGGKKFRKNLLK